MAELDYLVVGHVTRDLVDGDYTVGGTVSYAARTARALGCRVGIVTSASPDLDLGRALDDVRISRIPAQATTTFENVYTAGGRRQILHASAKTLLPEMIPADWRTSIAGGIVHLGPVAQECDPALVHAFGDVFVGVTPQGWMRCWGQDGQVHACPWQGAERVLDRADAVVLSQEDVGEDESLVERYALQARLLVLTQGERGCTVYWNGRARHFPAPAIRTVDATGAGDVFAAVFFVWLKRSDDPWKAARVANYIAARSVTRQGLASTPSLEEMTLCTQALKREM